MHLACIPLNLLCTMMAFSRFFDASCILHQDTADNAWKKSFREEYDLCLWPSSLTFNSCKCFMVQPLLLWFYSYILSLWKKTSEDSVYGKREGALPGLCIMSAHRKNIFRQSRAFKTGVVHGISMLQRADMVKPESVSWNNYQNLKAI